MCRRLSQVNSAQYSCASDVWALGVCFFEMVALHRPYEGASLHALAYNIGRDPNQNAMRDWLAAAEEGGEAWAGAPQPGCTCSGGAASLAQHNAHCYDPHLLGEGGAPQLGRRDATVRCCACLTESGAPSGAIEGMLHKRPNRRATLPELLSREALVRWGQKRELPLGLPDRSALDDLTPSADSPDVMMWGGGARLPRLRTDLSGISVTAISCGAVHAAAVCERGAQTPSRLTARVQRPIAAKRRHPTLTGLLYTWGASPHGQLGDGARPLMPREGPIPEIRDCLHRARRSRYPLRSTSRTWPLSTDHGACTPSNPLPRSPTPPSDPPRWQGLCRLWPLAHAGAHLNGAALCLWLARVRPARHRDGAKAGLLVADDHFAGFAVPV